MKRSLFFCQAALLPKFALLFCSCPQCWVSGRGVTTSSSSCSSSWRTTRTSHQTQLKRVRRCGRWQKRPTTKARTTRPCQTCRLSRSWLTCHPLRHPHLACRTWSAASLCGSCMALVHDESCKKKMSHITIVTCVLFSCAVVFVLCVLVVCPAKDSLVTKKNEFFSWFLGRWWKRWPQKVLTQGDFCAVLWMSE